MSKDELQKPNAKSQVLRTECHELGFKVKVFGKPTWAEVNEVIRLIQKSFDQESQIRISFTTCKRLHLRMQMDKCLAA